MKGKDAVEALKSKFRVATDQQLAKKLGLAGTSIQNWRNRKVVTARQFAGLVEKAANSATVETQRSAIWPIVEFYSLEKCIPPHFDKYQLFDWMEDSQSEHPYRNGLRQVLCDSNGIYVFFDSRGRAIYVGKAKKQNLWKEMNLAFNRERDAVQTVMRVSHPEIKKPFKDSDEMSRQIKKKKVLLHELAAYFSAYRVVDGMIDDLEALLVRSFANDLLNIKMEKFGK